MIGERSLAVNKAVSKRIAQRFVSEKTPRDYRGASLTIIALSIGTAGLIIAALKIAIARSTQSSQYRELTTNEVSAFRRGLEMFEEMYRKTNSCCSDVEESKLSVNGSAYAAVVDGVQCASLAKHLLAATDGFRLVMPIAIAVMACQGVVLPHIAGLGGGFVGLYLNRKTMRSVSVNGITSAFKTIPNIPNHGKNSEFIPGVLEGYKQLLKAVGVSFTEQGLLFRAARVLANSTFTMSPDLLKAVKKAKSGPSLDSDFQMFLDLFSQGRQAQPNKLLATKLTHIIEKNKSHEAMGREIGNLIPIQQLEMKDSSSTIFATGRTSSSFIAAMLIRALKSYLGVYKRQRVTFDHRSVEAYKLLFLQSNLMLSSLFDPAQVTTVDHVKRLKRDIEASSQATTVMTANYDQAFGAKLILVTDNEVFVGVSTLNSMWGSKRAADGIVFNNFAQTFHHASRQNRLTIGAFPVTSFAPLIYVDNDQLIAVVADGKSNAVSSVAHCLLHVLRNASDVETAMTAPRFHHIGNKVLCEKGFETASELHAVHRHSIHSGQFPENRVILVQDIHGYKVAARDDRTTYTGLVAG